MTAIAAENRLLLPLSAVVAGSVALVARPPLLRAAPDATALLVTLFVLLLAVGALLPLASTPAPVAARTWTGVFALGIAAFAVGRLLGGGEAPAVFTAKLVALNTLAAVAEEAFFRRLVFDVFRPGGDVSAVVGSALLFAIVHVPVYGLWVLPIDLAAGLVLSWQRWATGTWTVPAATHVVANLLVVI